MKERKSPRIIFAGDRAIALRVLQFIIKNGNAPAALMVSDPDRGSHVKEIIRLGKYLDPSLIFTSRQFRFEKSIKLLKKLKPDYIISVHFPYIIPMGVLKIPTQGVLNLHPAYLPYNRGWHTPTWAILDGTPYGATLHFMDEGIDTGDVVIQKKIKILPDDTADTLYSRVLDMEFEIFKKAWPSLASCKYRRKPQAKAGSIHKKSDIASIREIRMDKNMKAGDLIKTMRALTTNDINESAYFRIGGRKYRMQIKISKE